MVVAATPTDRIRRRQTMMTMMMMILMMLFNNNMMMMIVRYLGILLPYWNLARFRFEIGLISDNRSDNRNLV